MKSFCIKTNNEKILSYLLKNLEISSLENIYFVNKEFKCYKNIIVHYLGNDLNYFLVLLSDIITDSIMIFYEPILFRKLLNFHYFYFDDFEKKIIEQNCYNYLTEEENKTIKYRKNEIENSVLKYISENKSMILDGFVTFRLENYLKTLEEIIDYSVQQYVIEKEYTEFINLLEIYINSKEPCTSLIHLIYINGESVLLRKR